MTLQVHVSAGLFMVEGGVSSRETKSPPPNMMLMGAANGITYGGHHLMPSIAASRNKDNVTQQDDSAKIKTMGIW